MLLAIKRNGKWERTDRLDRLCWRLGPTFISLNRRLDYFRDRWFPRAEATDIALEANPAKDGTAKPAEKAQGEFELEGPWSRFLVGILDILLGWCLFWTCRADLDAQANGRALERIEKRLDAAAGGQTRGRVAQRGRENGVEDLAPVAEQDAENHAIPLVERDVSGGSDAGAGENGLVVPEGLWLPPDNHPAILEFLGDDGVRPSELNGPAGGPDSLKEFVVLSLHAEDDSTTRTAAATKNQEL